VQRAAILVLTLFVCTCNGASDRARAAQSVVVDGQLSRTTLAAGSRSTLVARVHVAAQVDQAASRPHANLALVVDTSGSMQGVAIEHARRATQQMIDALADGDRVAIVAFGSTTEILLASTELEAATRSSPHAAVTGMEARGTTDMAGGLRAGIDQVAANFEADGTNRVVLLGDGVPNDAAPMLGLASEARSRGIGITVLGLGLDFDETLMGALAERSGGRYRFIGESSDITRFFGEELTRLSGVVAKNVEVELAPGPNVDIVDVIGRPVSRSGRSVRVVVGDVGRDAETDLFVELAAVAGKDGGAVELFDAVVRYERVDGTREERRLYLGAAASSDPTAVEASRNRDVEDAATIARGAAAMLGAIEQARNGNAEAAQATLETLARERDARATDGDGSAVADQAKEMRELATELPHHAPAPRVAAPSPIDAAPAADLHARELIRRTHDRNDAILF
jgi:Ca-activated chloride channel homolog